MTGGAHASIQCTNTPHSSLAFYTLSPFAMIAKLPIFVMVESEKEVDPEMP